MRHGRGTCLAFFYLLFEILHRDVCPDIPVKVDKYGVYSLKVVEQGGKIVVMFNLGSCLLPLETECLFKESVGKCNPVNIGICGFMCVEISCSSTEFSFKPERLQKGNLRSKPFSKNIEFFAYCCRGGRLAVRMGHHGYPFPLLCPLINNIEHLFKEGQVDLCKGISCGHRESRIVNILGGKSEMNKFRILMEFHGPEFFFQEVFYCFYIMVGFLLQFFYPVHIGFAKAGDDLPEFREGLFVEIYQLGQGNAAKGDEIFHLNFNPVSDDGRLGKVKGEFLSCFPVSSVYRRNGINRRIHDKKPSG